MSQCAKCKPKRVSEYLPCAEVGWGSVSPPAVATCEMVPEAVSPGQVSYV